MSKNYIVDGEPFEVAPHLEEQFLADMKSQGKTPRLSQEEEEGKTTDDATDANATSTTAASNQETDQSQDNQQQNTESTSGDTSSVSPNFDWLNYRQNDGSVSNKPFFDQSEEQAVAQLRAKYPGFKFEETNYYSSDSGPRTFKTDNGDITKNTAQGGFNAVKMISPDGKNSKKILLSGASNIYEMSDTDYEKSYGELTSFVNQYSTDELNIQAAKDRDARIQQYKNFNSKVDATEEEKAKIKSDYDKEDLFEPVEEEIVAFRGMGMESKYTPNLPTKTRTTQPHEEELKQARKQLEQEGGEITSETVQNRARQILADNEVAKIKKQNTEALLDNAEDLGIERYGYELNLAAKEFTNDYNSRALQLDMGVAEIEESDLGSDIIATSERLQDENYTYEIKDGEPAVKLESGKVVPASVLEKYNANVKEFNKKKDNVLELNKSLVADSHHIKDVGSQMDLLRRNYNGWEEFAVETAIGLFSELPAAVNYGASRFLGGADEFKNDEYIKHKNRINSIRESYKKDVEFDDAFSSISNFGEFAAQELSNQIPIFTALAIPGGMSLIGAQSFGDQYSDMVREDRRIGGDKTSQTKKWFTSLGFAVSEVAFESLTTLPLIRNAKAAFLNNPAKNQMWNNAVGRYFKNNASRALVYQPLAESASEGMTTLTQNLISGKPLTEGLDHSMFSGLMFGTTMSTAPFAKGLYVSKFSDFDTKEKCRGRVKQMQSLETLNNKIKKGLQWYGKSSLGTVEDVEANNKKIKELQEQNEADYKKIEDKVKSLTPRAAKFFFGNSNRLEAIRLEAARIEANTAMPQDVKESRLADLKAEFDATQASLDEFKNSNTFNNNWSLFKGDKRNKAEIDRIQQLATDKLEAAGKRKADLKEEDINEEARIIYNKEIINKDIAKKKGNYKLRKSLVSHETVDETVDYLKKDAEAKIAKLDDSLTPEQKKKATNKIQSQLAESIQAFKEGAHGAMQVDANGKKVALVNVDNMAKGDRLETRTHELGHVVFTDALGVEQESYRGLSDQILSWTKENQSDSFKRIMFNTERDANGQLLPAEVVSVFLEEVAAGKINLNKKRNSTFAGLLGHLISRGTKEATDIDIDLAGETDAIKFLIGLGQRIKKGDLKVEDIEQVKKSKVLDKFQKSLVQDSPTTMFSQEASDRVQKAYDEMGEAGAMDVIEEFKPITYKQAMRFRDVPGFNQEDMISEIEIGKRGIFDLIREYNPDSGVPLAAYINKYLPVRANEAANRVLGEEFMDDVTEAKAVTATETAEDTIVGEDKPKRKGIVLTDRLNVRDKVEPKAKEFVKQNDIKGATYKNTPNISTETVGELMGIAPKKITNNANLTKPELANAQMFINKNADMLMSMLPEGFTSQGKTTGVQKVLLEGLYNKKSVRAKTKAGLNVQVKRPDITRAEFLERFGIVDGKRSRDDRNTSSRVLALAKQLDRAMSNQAIREVLMDQGNVPGIIQTLEDGKSPTMFSRSVDASDNQTAKDFFYAHKPEFLQALRDGNDYTDKGIKAAFNKVYMFDDAGKKLGILPTAFKNAAIGDYIKMLKPYAKIKQEDFDSIKEDFVDVEEYVTMYEADQTNQETLVKFLGLDRSMVGYFSDPVYKASYRNFINDIAQDLISKGESVEQVVAKLIVAKGFMESGTSAPKRAMAFGNKLDLVNGLISNLMPSVKDFNKKSSKGKTTIEFIYKDGSTKTVETLQQPSQKVSKEMVNDNVSKEEVDLRNKSALENWNLINGILESASNLVKSKDNNYSKAEFAMLNAGFLGSMTSPLRAAASLKYLPVGVKETRLKDTNGKRLWEYEHGIPAKALAVMLIDHHLNGNKIDLNKLRDSYSVGVIHKDMNDNFGRMFQERMQLMYKIGDAPTLRWYNRFTQNGNLHAVKDVNTGDVHGEKHVAISKKVKETRAQQEARINAKKAKAMFSRDGDAKGMSTFDFDETLIIGGENFVVATNPETKEVVKIMSHDWPIKGPALAAEGYNFDFSDFANVRGGKEGPLLQKMKNQIAKYGNKNVFVLTARQQDSAVPIHQWLKSQGISIPLRNITGLGKSEGSAKAQWMLQKFAEGYNDMYFVDDALPNVKAVKDVLDQLDIKSKVVQAKIQFSKEGGVEFNNMLERNTGVPVDRIFSNAQARLRGSKAGGFKFFVPPSAEDFKGLLYNFLGKGEQGDADMAFFKKHLLDPFSKGIRGINTAKQRISEEYKTLKKEMPKVAKGLNKMIPNSDYTLGDAIRVYLWDANGISIPGISEAEIKQLVDHIKNHNEARAFADNLGVISRSKDGYVKPDENWVIGSVVSDLHSQTSDINRSEFLKDWIENKDIIFSPENMNKIEAVYGTDFKDALENMLFRMQTGSNRVTGKADKTVNKFMDWINGSVGAVMFFNTRSAALQTLSTINFINWSDNNVFAASAAFANQPQYWKDFMTLFNSDMLKQRRSGMAIDVNLAELSNAVSKASGSGKAKAALRYLLQIGFTPTQIADSFAIASGGATFYRNRIKKYTKEGMSQKEAEAQAFEDFQEIAEETQQSSRPDLISQQQAGSLGRLVLAWQNTPMQYTRLTKKAISDLANGRGDWKSHVSRILYYGAMQNVIFGSLQTGLAFLLFGDDEDDDKTKLKITRVANGALDTLLRGTGVYGAMASTLKNTIMKYMDEKDKPYGKRELSKVALEAVQLSPPIGSKLRKIMSAIYSYEYNKGVPEKIGVSIDNPILNVIGNVVEATTNVPLARTVRKAQQIEEAINGNHELWKRVALIGGWDKWSLDIKDADVEKAKAEVKQDKKDKKKAEKKTKKEDTKKKEEQGKKDKGVKEVRCSATKSNGQRCKIMVETKSKTAKCAYHKSYKKGEGSDTDGDGIKEYQCTAVTKSGRPCKNRTEHRSKKCYAHQ